MTVQPMFATRQDFFSALAIREWHWRRLFRYVNQRLTADETIGNVVSSLEIATALTDIMGDGFTVAIPEQLHAALRKAGFKGFILKQKVKQK